MKTKQINSLILMVFLMSSFSIKASTLSKKEVKKQTKYINKLLKCTRGSVEQKRGGLESISFSANYLRLAKENKENISELKKLQKECNKKRKKIARQNDVSWDEIQNEIQARFDKKTFQNEILSRFADPYAKCKLKGANLNFGLGFVIGAGVKVTSCKATNGKRFFGIAPELEFGVGGGLHLLGTSNHIGYYIHTKRGRENFIHLYEGELTGTIGLGIAAEGEIQGEGSGLGIGVGLMITSRSGLNFKMIPRKNDFSFHRNLILK